MKGVVEVVSKNGGIKLDGKWFNAVNGSLASDVSNNWRNLKGKNVELTGVSGDFFSGYSLVNENTGVVSHSELAIIAFELRGIREALERLRPQ